MHACMLSIQSCPLPMSPSLGRKMSQEFICWQELVLINQLALKYVILLTFIHQNGIYLTRIFIQREIYELLRTILKSLAPNSFHHPLVSPKQQSGDMRASFSCFSQTYFLLYGVIEDRLTDPAVFSGLWKGWEVISPQQKTVNGIICTRLGYTEIRERIFYDFKFSKG